MANMNSNSNFSDDEMDISGIYGMENFMGGTSQNLEDLAGYNLNDSAWNGSMNNANIGNNTANVQPSNSGNRPQNTINRPNNANRPQDSMNNSLSLQPQRQEQTMPMNREPQTEMGMQNNSNNWRNMQSVGNIEDFLRMQIGKNVRMQFLIGTNTLIEKSGRLMAIGDNFVVLREAGSGEVLVCDFDDVKFIRLEDNSK